MIQQPAGSNAVVHSDSGKCLNCGTPLTDNYCSHCGQSARVGKITPRYLLVEVLGGVLQLDHGFLFTARELLLRPGASLHSILAGRRRAYSRPFGFLLIGSALYVLAAHYIHSGTILANVLNGISSTDEGVSKVYGTLKWLGGHYTYASLLLLPLFSLCTRLVFRRSGLCYSEHLVINMFIKGQLALMIAIIYPLQEISPYLFFVIWSGLGLYSFFALGQVFDQWRWVPRLLAIALCYILYWTLIGVLLVATVGLAMRF